MLYHKTNFAFSEKATEWVIKQYEVHFTNDFYHDLDTSLLNQKMQYLWNSSIVGKELQNFLKIYNLDTRYYGITTFISNSTLPFIGNPHVDTKFDYDGNSFEIKSRFNVMVLGNIADKMVWWDNYTYSDPRLLTKLVDINGRLYEHKPIPGTDPEMRWKWLGEPTHGEDRLLAPSAFVRTNCPHTVSVSPGPRIIVTVAFDKTIEEIVGV